MEKLNPQPEPPAPMDFLGLLVYIFQFIVWFFRASFATHA